MYVALGRVTRGKDLYVLTNADRLVDGGFVTRCITWPELFLRRGAEREPVNLESLTPVLLHINRRYKSVGSGIRITGIPETE